MERFITGLAPGLRLSGENLNPCGESPSACLMVRTLKGGMPPGRTSGKQKEVFCEALNPVPILLPIDPLLILSYILNSATRKAVTVAYTFGAGMRCRL